MRRVENIIFTGYRFGQDYEVLQQGAYIYIQATSVGGTHPALVESMGFANCVVANDTPEHVEVLEEAGTYFAMNDAVSLYEKLADLVRDPERVVTQRRRAYERARELFSWDKITKDYEELFAVLCK